jgi:hypothetical protein|uniref:hypothetical protein n=1 Tax=Candidatus Planktophila sp. TaxID=2175601 RepID=UPI004049AAB7
MSKHLVAHVGFHKTGTTALQESFAANRKSLKAQGVVYPNFGQRAHHRATWALIGRTWGWKNRGGRAYAIKEWKRLVRAINKSRNIALISSEFFCELSTEQIQKFKADIKSDQFTIVFTIRPLVKLLSSSYQQYLKYGLTPNYEEWLHSVLDKPGESKLTPTFWKRHNHAGVITKWVEVFGANNIVVVVADEKVPTAIFDAFNSILNLSKDTLTQPEGLSSNRSLTYEEISLLLEINRNFPEERDWSDYAIYIRDGAIRHLTDTVKPSNNSLKLQTPEWAEKIAREISALSVSKIKASGVRIIGNLDDFDTAEILIGENSVVSTISVETAAQAIVAIGQNSLKRQSTKVIFKEAKRRLKKRLRLGKKRSKR